MAGRLLRALKSAVTPVLERQWILERAKYAGTRILTAQEGNDRVAESLLGGGAFVAGKLGGVELGAMRHYLSHRDAMGHCAEWGRHAKLLKINAGVYPDRAELFGRFCDIYGAALGSVNFIAVWFQWGENAVRSRFAHAAVPMSLTALEPYFHVRPWSRFLAGKRVLVVTPFAQTVRSQYSRRADLWRGRPEVLPEFHLDVLACPLSAGLVDPPYPDWVAALDAMKQEMTRRAFDIALIGAGAWGIPLAAHARALGRTGIHLGGPTQLLFGIRGGRWDEHPVIKTFLNSAWVRPGETDRPPRFRDIEGGCYW